MPTFVDPIRFKSGSTDTLFGSTGGLVGGYGTPPSTSAYTIAGTTATQALTNKTLNAGTSPSTATHTLVGTTAAQALTNKTINNITITDPGSSATLTISSGGTLEAIGAFQHKFTSTANSAVTIPPSTDAFLMWTTELDGKITAKTSQINVLGVAVWPSTAAHTLVGTTATQSLYNKTLYGNFYPTEAIAYSDTLATTMTNYGIATMTHSTISTGPMVVTMANPIAGIEKTIILAASTVASSNYWKVVLGATTDVTLLDSTGGSTTRALLFDSSTITGIQVVALRGVSSNNWLEIAKYSTAITGATT